MSPKEALIKDGQIPTKLGRGRMSREQKSRCQELANSGWNIDGYSSSTAQPVKVEKTKAEKSKAKTNTKVISDFVIFYEEDRFKAVAKNAVYSMREVCNTCRVSLVQCHCGNPTILGGIVVTITPR